MSVAKRYNLKIETPDLEIASAASRPRGALAYDDRETLLLARLYGWTCITNDKPLRRECEVEGVPCLWGLEPMKALVEHNLITVSTALTIAKKIRGANPMFITEAIIQRFDTEISEIQAKNEQGQ